MKPATRQDAKAMARDIRDKAKAAGKPLSHSAALEAVARQSGFADWNTMAASLPETGWQAGARVTGAYLGQTFTGTIVDARPVSAGWTRVSIQLDEPVDVVRFDSFQALRRRITGTIGPAGHSGEATSDGTPHLVLNP